MSDQETEQEPSIEEILTSIRQIISDDDDETENATEEDAGDSAAEEPPEPIEDAPLEDAIELTDVAEEAAPEAEEVPAEAEPQAEPQPEPEPEVEPEPSTDIEVEMKDFDTPEPVAEPEPMPESVAPTSIDEDDLLTQAAEDAAFDAFSELAKKTTIEHNGITVEEIVRTELRPMLKSWLDKHLPTIIERLVQEELERVSKRAMEE